MNIRFGQEYPNMNNANKVAKQIKYMRDLVLQAPPPRPGYPRTYHASIEEKTELALRRSRAMQLILEESIPVIETLAKDVYGKNYDQQF